MDDIDSGPEPQSLRFLRRLVTVLTITMIGGVLVVIVLLVIRLRAPDLPALPPKVVLPEGVAPVAFTRGRDWFAVTSDTHILIYGLDGSLRQEIEILKAPETGD